MNKTSRSVVTDYRLELRFEQLRTRLAESSQADGLERPLAFFAASNDRHLPLALIDRTVGELIGAPLAELRSVPGIGPKKLNSLMDLLERALPPHAVEKLAPSEPEPELTATQTTTVDGEQPGRVSEADWEQWRAAIRRHHLERETLGRFAPTLRRLPRSLWTVPLDGYLDSTLGELRRRKNHGEKRVSAILEIFGALHKVLLRLDEQSHLSIHLRPRFATSIESWLAFRLRQEELPTLDEVNQAFVEPLIAQLDVDGGDTHAKLARDRLNPKSSGMGNAARRMGLARGRAYEMLGDAQAIMAVRWPDGGSVIAPLLARMRQDGEASEATSRVSAAANLFFGEFAHPSAPASSGSQGAVAGQLFQSAAFCVT
ncbi:MAG TPA: hypothetical protein VHC19_18375 [Pirellulales bacterium]|nr:hypothetical protein [Pirellulales bacterium]